MLNHQQSIIYFNYGKLLEVMNMAPGVGPHRLTSGGSFLPFTNPTAVSFLKVLHHL